MIKEYVSDADCAPFIICMLVDWLGPERIIKFSNAGGENFVRLFILEPENVNETWNLSLSDTVVSFTEAVNSCAKFIG
jgi:hypothetical protein